MKVMIPPRKSRRIANHLYSIVRDVPVSWTLVPHAPLVRGRQEGGAILEIGVVFVVADELGHLAVAPDSG